MKSKKLMSHKTRLNIIKLGAALAIILLLMTPVSSTSPQIDMYSMVTSLGLDTAEDGGVKCTAEVILPEENKGAMGVSIIIDGEGQTLSSALENLSISIGRTLDLSHCAILVVGKDKATEGITKELEYLLSSSRVSPEISVILSGNKDAGEFVKKLNDYSQKLDADNLLRYTDFGSHNYSQSLIQFLKNTYGKSQTAVMACIEMGSSSENQNAVEAEDKPIPPEEKDTKGGEGGSGEGGGQDSGGGSQSGGSQGGGEGGSDNATPTIIRRTDKIGIFCGGKLDAVWGAVEGNALAWSDQKTKIGHMVLENLEYKGQTIDKLSCYLVKKKVKIHSKFKDGLPVLQLKVTAQFTIDERFEVYRVAETDNSDEVYDIIKAELKKEITRMLMSVMEKSKEENADTLLARDYFYRYHKRQYDKLTKSGEDILEMTTLDIKYDIKIN